MSWITVADIVSMTIAFAVPLMLVALGGMFSERSGIINLALEGIMIIGALAGSLTVNKLQSFLLKNPEHFLAKNPTLCVFIALIAAAVVGIIFSILLAFAAINLRADQTIGGTALNIFAPAIAVIITWAIQGQGQTTINIPSWTRMSESSFGLETANDFVHTLVFKNLYLTTIIAIFVLIISTVVLYKTKFGLRLRACGEHPQAADSVGINVKKMRYAGVMISGALAGMGGLAYTLASGSGFQSTVGGYGFLALAVMIFGNWKPVRIMAASLFFALFRFIGFSSASISFLPQFESLSNAHYIYKIIPYVITMIVLVFTSKRSQAPKAEGIPYDKGQR